MNDTRTKEQKQADLRQAIYVCERRGWRHIDGMLFTSPKGATCDLSSSDLTQLDEIEKRSLFRVAEGV